jgi:hypothetical protein
MAWNHEVGGDQPAPAAQEPPDDRGGDAERRIGHYPERAPRKPEIGGIDLHHGDVGARKSLPELAGPTRVKLDRDDTRTGIHQRTGDRAGTGANIENKVAGFDPCRANEPTSPVVSELMPSPACPPSDGHDAPSPSSTQA